MKYLLPFLLLVLLLCIHPSSHAAFVTSLKTVNNSILAASSAKPEQNATLISVHDSLPRGRGNGKDAMMAFMLGCLSIFPVLGVIPAIFAYKKGFKNLGRIRKYRGLAIAGIILATIGVAFTILILTV